MTPQIILALLACLAVFAGGLATVASASDAITSTGPSYVVRAPAVLRPGGGYTAAPSVSKRLRPAACVRLPRGVRDVAVTTASGSQLARDRNGYRDVVNGAPGRVAVKVSAGAFCSRTPATLWVHGWGSS